MHIFSFDDRAIKYSCKDCISTCCQVNNYLALSRESATEIKESNLLIYENFYDKSNNLLRCSRKCWFLSDNGCTLKNKPSTCSLYPLDITLLTTSDYLISYIPCPNFEIDYNKSEGINHFSSVNIVKEYIDSHPKLIKNKSVFINKQRIKEEIIIQKEFYQLFYKNFNGRQDDEAKLIFLYPQIRWSSPLLKYPSKIHITIFNLYKKIVLLVIKENPNLDLYNKYIIIQKNILEMIENEFVNLKGGEK